MKAATSPQELETILRAQRGDMDAFEEIVRSYRAGVVGMVYRMFGDAALAEDAAQEAFIRAWRRLDSYRPVAPIRNWLYRIAINAARDSLRREHKTVDIEELPLPASGLDPEAAMIHSQRIHRVRQAIRALPVGSREVLILREYEDLSYRDIARVLDIPIGTVMSRLHTARQSLRENLAEFLETQ